MPGWLAVATAIMAAAVTLTVVWGKILKPGANLISDLEDERAFLRTIIAQFANAPGSFAVLQEIVKEFRTDSGSSLRDAVNRIEKTANDSSAVADTVARDLLTAATVLKARVDAVDQLAAAARKLDAQDRLQLEALDAGMSRLVVQMASLERALSRLEAEGGRVAAELGAAQGRADVVAADPATDAGAAADEASLSPPDVRPGP